MTTLRRTNPNTIQDKVLVGYQGWFTCAGDGQPIDPGHHGWLHWFNSPIPNGGRPNVDLWPDTSDYDPSELHLAPGLATASGDPVHLFSSRNPKTVWRHFHWMALHGVDGAFLQRFAGQCEVKSGNHGIRDLRDEVGDRVREAAEAEGRVFAIMYDVSGVSPDKIQNILEQDWAHLLRDKRILDSPNYIREKGRPVVALWGFGFNGRNHTPELVRAIAEFFHSFTPGGVYLVAGAPGHWRTSTSDADRNPEFVQVWTDCFDAISPWTVGRYGNEEEADHWGQGRLKADADHLRTLESEGGRKVDYIPVVLPGGSGFNLSEGKWRMNDMRRNGGRFLWTQIYNARRAGVRTLYGAMWDEYDEGTAFMPVVSYASQLPVHSSFRFLALDVDGHDLPSDWYMRVLGYAAEAFHGERTLLDTFPVKELQDYWSTRPRYERDAYGSGGAVGDKDDEKEGPDVEAVTRAFREWEIAQGRHPDAHHEAPPPYSLEDEPAPAMHHPSTPVSAPTTPVVIMSPPPSTQVLGSGGRPPVRQDTRPTTGRSEVGLAAGIAAAAAIPLVAGAIAAAHTHTHISASSSPAPSPTTTLPPRVNMSARPPPPPRHPTTEMGMGRPAPIPASSQAPGPGAAPPPAALRPGSPPTRVGVGRQGTHPQVHAHVPSLGQVAYAAPMGPPPAVGLPPGGPPVPHPLPVPGPMMPTSTGGIAYARGRQPGRSRSRSRSKSRSHSRKRKDKHKHKGKGRSRSRSSSGSKKGHGHGHGHGHVASVPPPMHSAHSMHSMHGPEMSMHPHRHGSYSSVGPHGHSPGPAHTHGHEHGHGHNHSLSPVGSTHVMPFPGASGVMYDAYSGGHGQGQGQGQGYIPVHSHPVGYGGSGPGPGLGYAHGQGGQGYAHGQGPQSGAGAGYVGGYQPQGGYGYPPSAPPPPPSGPPPGQGYDAMGYQQQGYGYTPHPSGGYYPPYANSGPPGPGPSMGYPVAGSGGGGGPMQGGIASALQAVEGIAGTQTRMQLERTVKSFTGSSLFNKRK